MTTNEHARTSVRLLPALAVALLAVPAAAQQAPNAPAEWGPVKAGLQVSLSGQGEAAAGGEFDFQIALRNAGTGAVALPNAGKAAGWFVIGQQTGTGDKVYYSQRYYPALGLAGWPAELAPGKTIRFDKLSIGEGLAYPSAEARKLLNAYLAGKPAAGVAPAGKIGDIVQPGEVVVRFALMLPKENPPPLAVRSNKYTLTVKPRPLKALSPEGREKFVAELLAQFDKDEWAGKNAHGTAVALGTDVVPYLIKAVKEQKRPAYSRMWMATALADIRDERAAKALIELLDDRVPGVRYVVGYHGPKQKSDKLDTAIIDKVAGSRDTKLTAYTVLGFTVFRGTAPERLLKLSLDSPEPRVRSTVARALKGHASDFNLSRLMGLLKDPDERVRSEAARMLGQLDRRTPQVMRALVEALDQPGEHARQRICKILVEMTGLDYTYDPKADKATREETLGKWRDWIKKAPKRR
ncbi:MAG TPA: HEAT repeat domain-containing protein [Phycisphaerae bacterium]|nr:HEAT repeat domain-containing protein [Phycisphaerae bacterium]